MSYPLIGDKPLAQLGGPLGAGVFGMHAFRGLNPV
jgi:hypothetical protein